MEGATYRVQDVLAALDDVDRDLFPADLGVVPHDIFLAEVVDLRGRLYTGGPATAHDETQQATALFG